MLLIEIMFRIYRPPIAYAEERVLHSKCQFSPISRLSVSLLSENISKYYLYLCKIPF